MKVVVGNEVGVESIRTVPMELAQQPFAGQGSECPIHGGKAHWLPPITEVMVYLLGGGMIGTALHGGNDEPALPRPPQIVPEKHLHF